MNTESAAKGGDFLGQGAQAVKPPGRAGSEF